VKHHDVGPLRVALPVFRLGDKPVGNILLTSRFNEVADVVALFLHFPGDVSDEPRERHEEKLAFVQSICGAAPARYVNGNRLDSCYKTLKKGGGAEQPRGRRRILRGWGPKRRIAKAGRKVSFSCPLVQVILKLLPAA